MRRCECRVLALLWLLLLDRRLVMHLLEARMSHPSLGRLSEFKALLGCLLLLLLLLLDLLCRVCLLLEVGGRSRICRHTV